jgi:hypothetical protein
MHSGRTYTERPLCTDHREPGRRQRETATQAPSNPQIKRFVTNSVAYPALLAISAQLDSGQFRFAALSSRADCAPFIHCCAQVFHCGTAGCAISSRSRTYACCPGTTSAARLAGRPLHASRPRLRTDRLQQEPPAWHPLRQPVARSNKRLRRPRAAVPRPTSGRFSQPFTEVAGPCRGRVVSAQFLASCPSTGEGQDLTPCRAMSKPVPSRQGLGSARASGPRASPAPGT